MKTQVRKIGNSFGLLIPKSLLAQAGIELGEVNIEVEANAIVISKSRRRLR